ncbi:DUF1206 domain-containing protein [Allorhizocola rhizosphaerae]|uniref:DUF1206 domain-containing protein n=1 Tax=Allorhizocola rhizosphaerae TaxID=1872709 RepID=UPI001FEABFF3|nr:DUF1206 domain-containing protein [Allorhizocola rhizosphaerae]
MSATTGVQAVARSGWLERLTRAGFLGYGLTHLLLAWVALQIAAQRPAADADQSGALRLLADDTLGSILVLLVTLGFAAMALWQALLVVVGHREFRGNRRRFERLASAARTVLYGYLGWTAWKVFKGAGAGGDAQQQNASDLMSQPNGTTLVTLAGVALALFGAGLIIYGWLGHFVDHMRTAQMGARMRDASRWLGIVGYIAKGVAYGVAGVLLAIAGSTYDPAKARGLDAALRTLAGQPHGGLVLTTVAAGLGAFGVFCFVQARYRRV